MKRIGSVGIWVVAGLQLGCNGCSGASTTRTVVAVPDQEPALRVAQPATSSPSAMVRDEPAQGHTFRPVTHPPHTFASYRPLPDTSLPRLVQRQGCFASQRDYSVQYPTRHQAPAPTMSGGQGAASGSSQHHAGAPQPKKRAAPSSVESMPSAAAADLGGGAGYPGAAKAEALPAPSPPPAEARDDVAEGSAAAPIARERAEQGRVVSKDKGNAEGQRRADERAEYEPEIPHAPSAREYHDWGASLYLSNDDTMSLSSAQRVLFAIDRGLPLSPDQLRPHEFLNYFSFDTAPVAPTDDFSVLASIAPKPGQDGMYSLGISVSGRDVTRETRRNAGLTLVVDRSGSMADEGRMDYLKQGLRRMTSELKTGDLVNLVLFDDSVCTPLENFVVGRDSMALLERTISRIEPRGSTDLNAGLTHGYRLANEAYRDAFTNRVVLISDAIANTGVTDPELMSLVTQSYDQRRIRLSGVGVGRDFNDELLNRLTEKGKGAYVFLGSAAEVDAVFGSRFISLIETVANDVHFRLHLPPSLRMNTFYGEESSVVKSDVQAIHYFAGTNQLFLSDLMSKNGTLDRRDDIMLTVEYENPETGVEQVEEFAFNLGQIDGSSHNLNKGRLIMSFIDGLKDIELTRSTQHDPNYGYAQCSAGRRSLSEQADGTRRDPEIERILSVWQHYCARYPEPPRAIRPRPQHDAPSGAVHRNAPRGGDVWPSAH